MGMAASQARLLTITARLADNELRSQTINNAKMRLATQSSQASENYISALNDAVLKFSNYDESGNVLSQDLTFNALTAYSSYNTQYGLVNAANQLLVSESEAAVFEAANGNLNAYLKAHGLEYTTTYFEQIGSLTNENYPEPYNYISVEDLKSYYEAYGSYETSVELQNFERAYDAYETASSVLTTGAKEAMQSYLLYSGNSPKITLSSGSITVDGLDSKTSIKDAYDLVYNAFLGSNNNTYNIEKLKANSYITEDEYNYIKDFLTDSIGYSNGSLTYAQECDISSVTDVSTGETTYTIGSDFTIVTNASGCVTSISQTSESQSDYTLTFKDSTGNTVSPDGSQTLESFLNSLYLTCSGTDDNGNAWTENSSFSYKQDSDGNWVLKEIMKYDDLDMVKQLLTSAAASILSEILYYTNYEAFCNYLLSASSTELNQYGIDVDANLTTYPDKTLQDVLDDFIDAKDTLIGTIFDDTEPVEVNGTSYSSSYNYISQALTNGDIDAADLTDIETLLMMIEQEGLVMSSSFETVVKAFIVEEIVSIYGEPKYAWVDENDTSNTGNADAKAQWYTNLFQRMTLGYKALEDGLASSKEWIQYALESGIVSMEQVDSTYTWTGLTYKTCTRITEETDSDAVTKAEAEYNRAMNDIESKDSIYDIQLKNIDTEHTSLQTEYESIQGVISKNIERTFKFNQSA